MLNDSVVTGLVSALGSSGVLGVVIKLILTKLSSDWKSMQSSVETLSSRIQTLETRLAVHDAVAGDTRSQKEEIAAQRREIIILQQQVQAAWRVLDKPRVSDSP
jgi:hypothetical protein